MREEGRPNAKRSVGFKWIIMMFKLVFLREFAENEWLEWIMPHE